MDTKIENFIRQYPGKQFPAFRSLTVQDAEKIAQIIQNQLGMPPNSSPLDLVKELRDRSSVIPDANAESTRFDLKSTILRAGIAPNKIVFINWYRFDQIDEMNLSDLSTHFGDIWYPAADDIDIFDETLDWIISIGYSGEVLVMIFNKTES